MFPAVRFGRRVSPAAAVGLAEFRGQQMPEPVEAVPGPVGHCAVAARPQHDRGVRQEHLHHLLEPRRPVLQSDRSRVRAVPEPLPELLGLSGLLLAEPVHGRAARSARAHRLELLPGPFIDPPQMVRRAQPLAPAQYDVVRDTEPLAEVRLLGPPAQQQRGGGGDLDPLQPYSRPSRLQGGPLQHADQPLLDPGLVGGAAELLVCVHIAAVEKPGVEGLRPFVGHCGMQADHQSQSRSGALLPQRLKGVVEFDFGADGVRPGGEPGTVRGRLVLGGERRDEGRQGSGARLVDTRGAQSQVLHGVPQQFAPRGVGQPCTGPARRGRHRTPQPLGRKRPARPGSEQVNGAQAVEQTVDDAQRPGQLGGAPWSTLAQADAQPLQHIGTGDGRGQQGSAAERFQRLVELLGRQRPEHRPGPQEVAGVAREPGAFAELRAVVLHEARVLARDGVPYGIEHNRGPQELARAADAFGEHMDEAPGEAEPVRGLRGTDGHQQREPGRALAQPGVQRFEVRRGAPGVAGVDKRDHAGQSRCLKDLGQQLPDVDRGADHIGPRVARHQIQRGVLAGRDAVADQCEDEHRTRFARPLGSAADRGLDLRLADGRAVQQ